MTMTDPIADMLTRVRNANVAMHDTVRMPAFEAEGCRSPRFSSARATSPASRPPRRFASRDVLEIRMKYTHDRARTSRA